MARSPRYWLRRRLAVRILRTCTPGTLIEIGCGTGELLPTLADMGYHGVGLEISSQSAQIARMATEHVRSRFEIVSDSSEVRNRRFQYACAFEVLEHIERDQDALDGWVDLLEPGGTFIASVPGHMRLWSHADEAVGHYRRYDRIGLGKLFESAGLTVLEIWAYGFPLTELTRVFRPSHARAIGFSGDRENRTLASATTSTARMSQPIALLSRGFGAIGHVAQLPFLRTDLGDGYFVIARLER